MRYLFIALFALLFYVIPISSAENNDEKTVTGTVAVQPKSVKKAVHKGIVQRRVIDPVKKLIGTASYYAHKFVGQKTATGDEYQKDLLTAASNTLPLGSQVRVTNMKNKRSVIVRINDLMHPKNKRLIDLSYAAAKKLDYIDAGLTKVEVVVLN